MAYAADSQYMYIFGGQDLNKGLFNNLWRINLYNLQSDKNIKSVHWEELHTKGDSPPNMSHCCMFVHQSKVYVFGGSKEPPSIF